MKNNLLSMTLLLCVLAASCKKDKLPSTPNEPETPETPVETVDTAALRSLVKSSKYNSTFNNGVPWSYSITYDYSNQNRLTKATFVSSNSTTTQVNNYSYTNNAINVTFDNSPITVTKLLDTKNRISSILYEQGNTDHQHYLSYDNAGRLQKLMSTEGSTTNSFREAQTVYFFYDANGNLERTSVARVETDANDPDKRDMGDSTVYTFSGFSADMVNTVKDFNFGYGFLGTASYSEEFMGGGYQPNIPGHMRAGTTLPSKCTINSYVYGVTTANSANFTEVKTTTTIDYTYEKDTRGRIIEIKWTSSYINPYYSPQNFSVEYGYYD